MKRTNAIYSLLILCSSQLLAAEYLPVGIIVPSKKTFKEDILHSKSEFKEVLGDSYKITPSVKEYSTLDELDEIYLDLSESNRFILSLDPVSSKYLEEKYDSENLITPFSENLPLIVQGANNFKEIYPFKSLTVLTTKDVDAKTIKTQLEESLNTEIVVSYIEDLTPVNTDATLLYNPTKKKEAEISSFIRDNLDSGTPTFSVMSSDYVDGGAIAGIISKDNSIKQLRSSALEVEKMLLNENFTFNNEPKKEEFDYQILFNLNSSKKLGIYPSREVLEDAVFVDSYLRGESHIDFKEAINIALANNLTLQSEIHSLEAYSLNPNRVASHTKPQLDAFGKYQGLNTGSAQASSIDSQHTLRGGLRASQTLFNDELRKDIFVEEQNLESQREAFRRSEIDTIFDASARYLNILSAEASLNIKNYNLDLTREFLEVAKNRKDVGISDSSDVFRLESLHAQSLTEVRRETGSLETSQRSLNQALNLPLETKLSYSSMDITDELFLTSVEGFGEILENPIKLQEFTASFINQSINNIPEVKSVDHVIQGKERSLKTANRKRYTPEAALIGEAAWDATDPSGHSKDGKDDKDNYWEVGVEFTIPLYQGGDIEYEKTQINSELTALENDKKAVIEDFERAISDKITELSIGYETIKNSKDAAAASDKNLELVRDNYAKGTVSITNLLDAQRDAVTSKEVEVIATYTFLITLLDLERTVGSYYFEDENSTKLSLENKIQTINSTGGKHEN